MLFLEFGALHMPWWGWFCTSSTGGLESTTINSQFTSSVSQSSTGWRQYINLFTPFQEIASGDRSFKSLCEKQHLEAPHALQPFLSAHLHPRFVRFCTWNWIFAALPMQCMSRMGFGLWELIVKACVAVIQQLHHWRLSSLALELLKNSS